jgi:PAS domain S-box-containing protein
VKSLLSRARAWLDRVPIADPLQRQHAVTLQLLVILFCAGVVLLEAIRIIVGGGIHSPVATAINALNVVIMIAALVLLRRGDYSRASMLFVVALGAVQALAIGLGGLQFSRDGLKNVMIVLALTALLTSRRVLWTMTAGMIAVTAIAWLRDGGFLGGHGPRPPPASPGGVFWVSALAFLIFALVLDRFGLTVRQALRDRLHAEEKLRASEERFRISFQTSPNPMSITRLTDLVLVEVNDALGRAVGLAPAAMVGHQQEEVGLMPVQEDIDHLRATLFAGTPVHNFPTRFRLPDGTQRIYRVSVARFDVGNVPHALAVGTDVTDEARMQEKLRRAEAMSAVGSLVAGVTHEVRNPLFGIAASLDALQLKLGTDTSAAPFMEALRREVDRLNTLMNDLLEYGKPSPPKLSREPIEPVLSAAARACDALAHTSGVAIEILADGAGEIPMDSGRLMQVFQNLIDNAVRHSPRDSTVSILVGPSNDESVEIRVLDRGRGFEAKDIPHVFEPFFTRRRGGTGLGLSIVQRIVEQHGGRIEAGNRVDGGAIVTVTLPRS